MAEAGARFEMYVRGAMTEAEISLAELARRSGVRETTWHAWFRGENQPRTTSLRLAGDALGVTPEQLQAAWFGARPTANRLIAPDPIVEAIDRQTAELRRLRAALTGSLPTVSEYLDESDGSGVEEGKRRGRLPQAPQVPGKRARSPRPQPRDSEAEPG